ncbi:bacillithiol biosynthesis cysteine-adding enzyme BshC [Virgibacillus salarius]|uniref:bacillithiol biosynthesis cysteine-adding enzyme BshC n=1 Tax=Virgibacillus salarius TaxID=447199 RepID=UPI00248F97BF|nr:bacillithiol biosynthesis cysteine-adding enzyme BshC [Virgibacillus salarius]WBX79658.1 bacillithiol biosynthesis cysteine-adding enzyme BshC [Virgibacillus salarius]
MRIDPIVLKKRNKLIQDYRNNDEQIQSFFDYAPFGSFDKRYDELMERSFQRESLCEVLHELNQGWNAPPSTLENIERLVADDSVVVIGGQQAGLMTGPMYTINKIISIIQFAREQEKILGVPVIPIFWIAGEDHDFDEVNHIYLPQQQHLQKYKVQHKVWDKISLSDLQINKEQSAIWLQQLFKDLKETNYTKELYEQMKHCLNDSASYVDFFAQIIFALFPNEGVVLIDSGDDRVRELEKEYFVQMIKQQPEISKGVHATIKELNELNYSLSLDVEESDGHLFFHRNGERILLRRMENGDWQGKQNEVVLTTDELVYIANQNPNLLSNNVVTRPLMQEFLFPSLAFIGGLGEIGYWASLKSAFHSVQLKMPPVLPRLSLTIVERHIEKTMHKFQISAEDAINHGTVHLKEHWFAQKNQPAIEEIAEQVKKDVERAHLPLREVAIDMRSDLGDLANKNLQFLKADVSFLESKLINALRSKHEEELKAFDLMNIVLHPENGLQERVWNVLPWINKYGLGFISELMNHSYQFTTDHYIIYV